MAFCRPASRRIRYIGNEGPEKWAGAVADHEEIISALEARDSERLSKVLNAHMEKTWERVKTRDLEPASPLAPASANSSTAISSDYKTPRERTLSEEAQTPGRHLQVRPFPFRARPDERVVRQHLGSPR